MDWQKLLTYANWDQSLLFLISQQIFTVEASGSDIAFDVTTNVSVTITLPEWIRKTGRYTCIRNGDYDA